MKLVQLLWPASLTVINSAPAIILGEVRKLRLTHLNTSQWEKAFLNIRGHIRTYEVQKEAEAPIVTTIVMAIRENHPRDGKCYTEATIIINKLAAEKCKTVSKISLMVFFLSSWATVAYIALRWSKG